MSQASDILAKVGQKYDEVIDESVSIGASHVHHSPRSGMSGLASDELFFNDGSKLSIGFFSEYGHPPYSDEVHWYES